MEERWINPIAWDLNLVERLRLAGWRNFQVDCEGGAMDERYIFAMAQLGRLGAIDPVFRIPANGRYLFDKAIKFGARRLMLSGGYTREGLEDMLRALGTRAHAGADAAAACYVMIESAAELAAIDQIASMENVTGIHFGLFDLSRDLGIADWRDVSVWERHLSEAMDRVRAMDKTCGSYCLPSWRASGYVRRLNVQSYAADEFCRF